MSKKKRGIYSEFRQPIISKCYLNPLESTVNPHKSPIILFGSQNAYCLFFFLCISINFIMPIIYKTSYRHSPLSGMGLFAEEDIPKGAIWWICDNNVKGVPCENAPNLPNLFLNQEAANKLVEGKSKEEYYQTIEHAMYYPDAELVIALRDGSGCVNHSFEPNSQIIYNQEKKCELLKSITLRDIKAGEEIVEDYGNFPKISNNWAQDFFRKHVPSRLEFQAELGIKKLQQ